MADLPVHGPVSAVLVCIHVAVTCSCGSTFDAYLCAGGAAVYSCERCGTVHHLTLTSGPGEDGTLAAHFTAEARDGEDEAMTPEQARRAEWRRSLRSGTGEQDG